MNSREFPTRARSPCLPDFSKLAERLLRLRPLRPPTDSSHPCTCFPNSHCCVTILCHVLLVTIRSELCLRLAAPMMPLFLSIGLPMFYRDPTFHALESQYPCLVPPPGFAHPPSDYLVFKLFSLFFGGALLLPTPFNSHRFETGFDSVQPFAGRSRAFLFSLDFFLLP